MIKDFTIIKIKKNPAAKMSIENQAALHKRKANIFYEKMNVQNW